MIGTPIAKSAWSLPPTRNMRGSVSGTNLALSTNADRTCRSASWTDAAYVSARAVGCIPRAVRTKSSSLKTRNRLSALLMED